MKNSAQMLSAILKTAQLGQTGIRTVLNSSMRPGLRKALEQQLQELDFIESEACAIAARRGWELRELEPANRFASRMLTRAKLFRGNADSRIAGMIIQTSTRGMIQGIQNRHQLNHPDEQVELLSQKLLDCENAGIRKMQTFL